MTTAISYKHALWCPASHAITRAMMMDDFFGVLPKGKYLRKDRMVRGRSAGFNWVPSDYGGTFLTDNEDIFARFKEFVQTIRELD
jgi:hypothetical protein